MKLKLSPLSIADPTLVTDEERSYTKKHADITAWVRGNPVSDTMIYRDGFSQQVYFFRDVVLRHLFDSGKVVSSHYSKSIKLPVVFFEIPGLQVIMRDNFHGTMISVNAGIDLDIPDGFFKKEEGIPTWTEGFDRSWIFPSFNDSRSTFSFEIGSEYMLFTLLYLIVQQVKKHYVA